MANAARVHAVENGQDLGDYTMIAFGGAAPLHAGRLAEKLGISRVLVPPGAGVGSAIGFLRAPFSFEANRSVYMKLSGFDVLVVKALLAELQQEATVFVRSCDANADIVPEFKAYMRYTGQGWEIPVILSQAEAGTPDADTYLKRFEAEYAALFGRTVAGMDVEITVWAVHARTRVDAAAKVADVQDAGKTQPVGERELFDQAKGEFVAAQVVRRADAAPGQGVAGPAVITEDETSIIVPSSMIARCQADGTIDLTARGAA